MDKKLKAKWVKALRSGEYKQAQQKLVYRGKYCCLGVLRCLLPKKVASIPMDEKRYSELLNLPQQKFVGLRKRQQAKLARMNDRGVKFPEIAKHIERYL